MNVILYAFAKRRNSTGVPASGGTTVSASWNDGASSLLAPSIRVSFPANTSYLNTNYVQIPTLSRYYWITNWNYNADGTWTARLQVDHLGSWRNAIRTSSGYVDRAAAASLAGSYIADTLYPATLDSVTAKTTFTCGMNPDPSGGTFAVTVIGDGTPNVGPSTMFFMNYTQLANMMHNMLDTTETWSSLDGFSTGVIKSMVNPLQYITKAIWFPYSTEQDQQNITNVFLGSWQAGTAEKAYDFSYSITSAYAITIPTVSGYGKYYAPYAKYTFISPVFGVFDLDPSICAKHRTLGWKINVNYYTGNAQLIVTTWSNPQSAYTPNTEHEFFRASGQLGIEIPVAQISTSYAGMAKGAVSAITAATAGPAGIPGILAGIASATEAAISPSVQSTGTIAGGFPIDLNYMHVQATYYNVVGESAAEFGYPVKQQVTLTNTISGYIKFVHSDFEAACTATEKDAIISDLESGVFLE